MESKEASERQKSRVEIKFPSNGASPLVGWLSVHVLFCFHVGSLLSEEAAEL